MPRRTARRPDKPFVGRWRIVEMERWDADYFEMDGPAFIEVDKKGIGYFKFGLVEGDMDCRFSNEDGLPAMEFSWNGNDECDPASGRGRAIIGSSGEMRGRIFLHHADDSEFLAKPT